MSTPSPLDIWPVAASADAVEVDHAIIGFTGILLLLTVPIFVFMAYCAAKYRAGRVVDRTYTEPRHLAIELSWMLIPFALSLIFFVWAARIYDRQMHPPPDALVITGMGRQWMWKFQHPDGQGEINDLHVPVNQAVRINLVSQDVVHALYIPALRIQMDVIPGRETQLWFKANQVGAYHQYCSEYCGTDHSMMTGTLYVMRPTDYQAWLVAQGAPDTMARQGATLFSSLGCSGCHGAGSTVRAPSLAGIYGSPVPLQDGGMATADDAYIIDRILYPDRNPIAGYQQKMPSFAQKVSDADLLKLVAYIRSLGTNRETR
jgi:cytochrome c oxidase subunit II